MGDLDWRPLMHGNYQITKCGGCGTHGLAKSSRLISMGY